MDNCMNWCSATMVRRSGFAMCGWGRSFRAWPSDSASVSSAPVRCRKSSTRCSGNTELSARTGVSSWTMIISCGISARSTANRICNSCNGCALRSGFTITLSPPHAGTAWCSSMGRRIFRWVTWRSSGARANHRRCGASRCSDVPTACSKVLSATRIWRRCAAGNGCRWPTIR
ncbi:hypothetical protein D3C87_1501060 [compost metagenome]